MGYLVCYSRSASDDHCRDKAIYLDQQFYETIFRHCVTKRSSYPVLSAVASLRYKSPPLIVSGEELESLFRDLTGLEEAGQWHRQLAEFRSVCTKARADGCSLSISGDMHPEL